jgi:hypothetical protein
MTEYFIQSTPLVSASGMFRYIMEGVRPFDALMAARLLESLGVPQEACVAVMDNEFHWTIEEDGETVRLVTYH